MIEINLYDETLEAEISALPYSNKIDDNGPGILIPESDYGFAEIYRIYDDIICFLIPPFGGVPTFHMSVRLHAIKYLIDNLKKIT